MPLSKVPRYTNDELVFLTLFGVSPERNKELRQTDLQWAVELTPIGGRRKRNASKRKASKRKASKRNASKRKTHRRRTHRRK